ncbi:MAG: GlsB/YeaQ/YmgE family stress response membrane protein [Alphaproteobacteria bacterium]|jgi:uncharacterized membrane protein YeaQ/YmgE (transglycosylase-associated protein family)
MPGLEIIVVWMAVGAIAGWLAGMLVRGAGFGLAGNVIVGIAGAALAGWLLPRLGVHLTVGGRLTTHVAQAAIGGVVVLVLLTLVRRRA